MHCFGDLALWACAQNKVHGSPANFAFSILKHGVFFERDWGDALDFPAYVVVEESAPVGPLCCYVFVVEPRK